MVNIALLLQTSLVICAHAYTCTPLWHQWNFSSSLLAGPRSNTVRELPCIKINFFFCRAIFNPEQLIGPIQPSPMKTAVLAQPWGGNVQLAGKMRAGTAGTALEEKAK